MAARRRNRWRYKYSIIGIIAMIETCKRKERDKTMKIESEFIRLLMEMGFLATRVGRLHEAETIFKAAAHVQPSSAYPQIGLGCVAMGRGNIETAVQILNNAPANERSERELCMGFLGMALKLGGYGEESRSVLAHLQTEGESQLAVNMADKLMAT